jgi:hypothetical protein
VTSLPRFVAAILLVHAVDGATLAPAQTITHRGFIEARGFLYPQTTPKDSTNALLDVVGREEVFVKPAPWIQFAGGVDLRGNTHDQVDTTWRVDVRDRGARRPMISVRRLAVSAARGPLTLDAGKQFFRWGKTDIVTPTDYFSPRDFLNVVDNEFLAVVGARGVFARDGYAVEAVWVPLFTPSRTPLLNQRWTPVPGSLSGLTVMDATGPLPRGSQAGVRWSHTASTFEYAITYFNGFNHLPSVNVRPGQQPFQVALVKSYPLLRAYGADLAVPTRWFTIKAETTYSTSRTPAADEVVLYVVQVERQHGEWMLLAGYAGEIVTTRGAAAVFSPDRGMARSIVTRASYTIDTNRSLAVEAAVRQTGAGVYAKGEYSQARGSHWRTTVTAVVIGGRDDDFLGQYRRNSHASVALRYSF